jgi:hypothetical protein
MMNRLHDADMAKDRLAHVVCGLMTSIIMSLDDDLREAMLARTGQVLSRMLDEAIEQEFMSVRRLRDTDGLRKVIRSITDAAPGVCG